MRTVYLVMNKDNDPICAFSSKEKAVECAIDEIRSFEGIDYDEEIQFLMEEDYNEFVSILMIDLDEEE